MFVVGSSECNVTVKLLMNTMRSHPDVLWCMEQQQPIDLKSLRIDHGASMISAAVAVYPDADRDHCNFHVAKACKGANNSHIDKKENRSVLVNMMDLLIRSPSVAIKEQYMLFIIEELTRVGEKKTCEWLMREGTGYFVGDNSRFCVCDYYDSGLSGHNCSAEALNRWAKNHVQNKNTNLSTWLQCNDRGLTRLLVTLGRDFTSPIVKECETFIFNMDTVLLADEAVGEDAEDGATLRPRNILKYDVDTHIMRWVPEDWNGKVLTRDMCKKHVDCVGGDWPKDKNGKCRWKLNYFEDAAFDYLTIVADHDKPAHPWQRMAFLLCNGTLEGIDDVPRITCSCKECMDRNVCHHAIATGDVMSKGKFCNIGKLLQAVPKKAQVGRPNSNQGKALDKENAPDDVVRAKQRSPRGWTTMYNGKLKRSPMHVMGWELMVLKKPASAGGLKLKSWVGATVRAYVTKADSPENKPLWAVRFTDRETYPDDEYWDHAAVVSGLVMWKMGTDYRAGNVKGGR